MACTIKLSALSYPQREALVLGASGSKLPFLFWLHQDVHQGCCEFVQHSFSPPVAVVAALFAAGDALAPAMTAMTVSSDHLQIGLGLGPNTTCKEPPTQQKGMCKCDQYGTDCYMWECPDYFEVPGAFVMKWSDQVSMLICAQRTALTAVQGVFHCRGACHPATSKLVLSLLMPAHYPSGW